MTATEVIAVIGVSSTAVVAVIGYLFNWFSGERSQKFARELADQRHTHEVALVREERLHEELQTTYADLARFTGWLGSFVERTHPLMGPVPPVPEPPSDQEALAIQARVSIHASDDVIAALDEVMRQYQRFKFAAADVDDPRHDARAWEELGDARQAFRDASEGVHRAIRNDLRP